MDNKLEVSQKHVILEELKKQGKSAIVTDEDDLKSTDDQSETITKKEVDVKVDIEHEQNEVLYTIQHLLSAMKFLFFILGCFILYFK